MPTRTKAHAFSLVELLVGLIIISLLVTAFIPLITKKLKASDITVGSFGNGGNGMVGVKRDVTKKDCEKMNAVFVPKEETGTKNLCVMKYHAGDGYYTMYGENFNNVQKCNISESCSVSGSTKDNLTPTCWVGKTANSTCNSNYSGGYSGCYRTVCNWTGANQMCNNMDGWRLATKEELDSFMSTTKYSNGDLGSNGLMFCLDGPATSYGPVCANSGYKPCLGSEENYCRAYGIWSSSLEDNSKAYSRNFYPPDSTMILRPSLNYAFSARCVKDYVIEESSLTNLKTDDECKQENCMLCTDDKCLLCKSEYEKENNQCVKKCSCENGICEEGSTTCTKCNDGYILLNNKCVTCTISNKLLKVGNICVMQYNAGDGHYDEKWDGVQKCTIGESCSVTGSTVSDLEATCWNGGYTADSSDCNANYGGYSGCFRTLCNWTAGDKLCKSIGRRLPTIDELTSFTNTTYSNTTINEKGLMLCDNSGVNGAGCRQIYNCTGAASNCCQASFYISSNTYNNKYVYIRHLDKSWSTYTDNRNISEPYSVRCVKDL